MREINHPIDNVQWVDVNKLNPNLYNPNMMQKSENDLLINSILLNGWIQPILITKSNIIIDGFHRYTLARDNKAVNELTDGKVPVCVLDISDEECKMLPIRINRAKGSHRALLLGRVIEDLINSGVSKDSVCKKTGMNTVEVNEILKRVNMLSKIKDHEYSEADVDYY